MTKLKELKEMSYYVVEVSFNPQNPIHRAICFHRVDGIIDLHGSYEHTISKNISSLTYFRVVEELESMNLKKYPNCLKLPKDVEKPNDLKLPKDVEEQFEYKGLIFQPYKKFNGKEGDFFAVSKCLNDSNLTPDGWSHKEFYESAESEGFGDYDLFLLDGKVVIPAENYLFEYTKK